MYNKKGLEREDFSFLDKTFLERLSEGREGESEVRKERERKRGQSLKIQKSL
jgi:hypothetical protein